MKNLFNILTVIVTIISIYLLVNLFSGDKNSKVEISDENIVSVESGSSAIAYINTDSLLMKYDFYEVLKDSILEIQKKHENDLQKRSSKFEKEVADFQRKVQLKSFLSQESAQQQEQAIYRKQQELMELKDQMSMNLSTQEQAMQLRLYDSVVNFLKIYNEDSKYQYILNKTTYGGSILYSNESDNITDVVANLLNERYQESIAK